MNSKRMRGHRTLLVFMVLFAFMVTSAWAAREIKIDSSNKAGMMAKMNQLGKFESTSLKSALGLADDEGMILLKQKKDFNRLEHKRYQQSYKGYPVWGMHTVISTDADGRVVRLHGNFILEIGKDIANMPGKKSLDPMSALKRMKDQHMKKDRKATWSFSNETSSTYIYKHKNGKAYLVYVVSFFADTEYGDPSRVVYFIDAKNNRLLHSYNNLQHADGTGPGGNQKIGQYEYGTDYPAFGVTQNGSTCTMNTTNVKTVNLNHGTSGTTAYSYTCPRNTVKEINGAYSPLNDAQYFGQVVYDMYNNWYGVPPLPFQLTMRVHYSTNYENAFWNGSSMTFGDGASTFYPLVCMDVSAHEVSHGFTENNSNLTYSGQSGGINEAFSDMAGEAAEFYMRGSNDFKTGYDIFKSANGALRYMYDPPLDGQSIGHVDDYYSGMDVHYSSGVYNKVFYLLAVTSGWDTHKAFDVFTKANQDYWTSSTNFQQGAEGALDAAADYGYSCNDVRLAFADVGITLVCPGPPVAEFSGTPTSGGAPLTVTFTDASTNTPTSWSWTFGDGGTSTQQNPVYTYTSSGSFNVTLTATNGNGSDSITKTGYITVAAPAPPIAEFTASSTSVPVGSSVTFTDQSLNAPTSWAWTFDGGTPGTGTAQNPSVTYNTAGTYTVALTATNAQGSDTETKVDYITVVVTPYCDSSGGDQSYEYVAGVAVGSMNNTSGASAYSDFTGITAGGAQGNSVSVSLTPGFTGSSYTEYWKIWVDYNHDQDFEDTGEEVFSGSGSSAVSGSFTVPSGAPLGTTRMRVSMSYSSAPPVCGSFSYGEVEDYTFNVTSGGVTYNLTTNTVGQGSITLDPAGGTYNDGTVVTVTATAVSGWTFDGWSGDLGGDTNPTTITMDADKSVTATFIEVTGTENVGNTTIFGSSTTTANRRAMPYTMPENGSISSVTMYHVGGGGNMILGVYAGEGSPQELIAVTAATAVSGTTGWQTIGLQTPVEVSGGSTIWLAWVYESNPGIAYTTGTPGRYDAGVGWSGGMPDPYGSGTQADYLYSIYATYTPTGGPSYNKVGNQTVFGSTSTSGNRRAMPFTMPETGTVQSVTMYHTAGSGNMILAVYDGEGTPQDLIGITASTAVSGTTGWQTINLTSPVVVSGGSTLWLAWVYETNPGIAYQTGSPGRYDAGVGWSGGMPDPYGTGSQADYLYSIYATYSTTLMSKGPAGKD